MFALQSAQALGLVPGNETIALAVRGAGNSDRDAGHPESQAIILAQNKYFSYGRSRAHRGHYSHDLRPLTNRPTR